MNLAHGCVLRMRPLTVLPASQVRLVRWRKTPVAAKVAHDMPQEQKQLVLREIEVMARLRHPNVVQFLGYVDAPFTVVMEYLPMGDLRAYWKAHKTSNTHKSQICIDVLRALAYLHNRAPAYLFCWAESGHSGWKADR